MIIKERGIEYVTSIIHRFNEYRKRRRRGRRRTGYQQPLLYRYGTAKRARQIIGGEEPLVEIKQDKPLSIAIEELVEGKIKIMPED